MTRPDEMNNAGGKTGYSMQWFIHYDRFAIEVVPARKISLALSLVFLFLCLCFVVFTDTAVNAGVVSMVLVLVRPFSVRLVITGGGGGGGGGGGLLVILHWTSI